MEKGWIKLHRKLLDNPELFRGSSTFPIWCYLLLRADQNGELKVGTNQISAFLKIKKSTVFLALKRIRNMNMIETEPKRNLTIIRICNWEEYQMQPKRNLTATGPKPDTIQEKNNNIGNNINIIPVKKNEKEADLVEKMIGTFESNLGFKLKQRPSQERAGRSIIKRVGYNKAMDAVQASILCQGDKYAPQIANLVQLDKKLDSLMIYWRKQGAKKYKIGEVE